LWCGQKYGQFLKCQGSISNTPEGTHAVHDRLNEAEDVTTAKALAASDGSSNLCRRPIVGAGEVLRNGLIGKIKLIYGWNKELRRIKSSFF
jgi:hypothetical protein